MELTRLFLLFLVSTPRNTFYSVLGDSFTRFDHVEFLNENVCTEGNTIQTADLSNDIRCLFLCEEQVSCRGVFVVPDATQCVTCSARFFYQNKTVSSVSSSFYKRNDVQSGSFYLLVRTVLTFYDAKQNCENLGGHLLILNSEEEMDFIYPHLVGTSNFWIGAKGTGGKAYTFEWVDGSKVSNGYSNWRGGQPYPNDNNEKYVNMVKIWNYQWNDEFDGGRQSICEFN